MIACGLPTAFQRQGRAALGVRLPRAGFRFQYSVREPCTVTFPIEMNMLTGGPCTDACPSGLYQGVQSQQRTADERQMGASVAWNVLGGHVGQPFRLGKVFVTEAGGSTSAVYSATEYAAMERPPVREGPAAAVGGVQYSALLQETYPMQ